jgi:hypothetical protein
VRSRLAQRYTVYDIDHRGRGISTAEALVLNLPTPYPSDVARWVTDELITPTLGHGPR